MPSRVIATFDYEPEHARLTIAFVSGRVYQYYAVPVAVAVEFRQALSKGAFFNARIRDRFPCRDVTPSDRSAPPGTARDRRTAPRPPSSRRSDGR
ncbi:MAG: KTSC domain-containing protein [Pseudolabrys sp.]